MVLQSPPPNTSTVLGASYTNLQKCSIKRISGFLDPMCTQLRTIMWMVFLFFLNDFCQCTGDETLLNRVHEMRHSLHAYTREAFKKHMYIPIFAFVSFLFGYQSEFWVPFCCLS